MSAQRVEADDVTRCGRAWYAGPWLVLAAVTAFWIYVDPDHMWGHFHALVAVPLVVEPLVIGLVLLLTSPDWTRPAGAVGLLAVAPTWLVTLTGLPYAFAELFILPPLYLLSLLLLLASISAAVAALLGRTPQTDRGVHHPMRWPWWVSALGAVAIAWLVFGLLSVLGLLRGVAA